MITILQNALKNNDITINVYNATIDYINGKKNRIGFLTVQAIKSGLLK